MVPDLHGDTGRELRSPSKSGEGDCTVPCFVSALPWTLL